MKTYNVHIYREMRLFFPGIVASTAEEAATRAAEMPSVAAEALEDCDGENLAALVGVVGHEDCKQSRMIDFDPVRAIMPDLLTALELALPILQQFPEEPKLRYSARYPVYLCVNIHAIICPSSAPWRSLYVGGGKGDTGSRSAQTSVR